MGSRALLSLIAASLSILATAGEATVDVARQSRLVRGPWWWRDSDGAPWVGVAVAGEPDRPVALPLDGAAPVAVAAQVAAVPGDRDGATHVLAMRLPPACAGTLRFAVGGEPVHARVFPPPPRDAPARIVLAGPDAWPDRRALAALAKALGGEPQLVLALGAGCPPRFGSGGWEAELPLAVVAPPDPGLAAATAGLDARWRAGLGLGVLGLAAASERGRADLALANDLSPWLVYVDAPAAWDPAVGRPQETGPEATAVLVAACQRLQVPLILGAGAAGLVSEPLTMSPAGALVTAATGVRVVLPVPSPDAGLGRLPDQVALPLEQPLAAGLAADAQRLELVLLPRSGDPLRLRWSHGEEPPAKDAAADAARRLGAAEDPASDRADIETLLWLPRRALTEIHLPPEQVARLRDEAGTAGRALARRLAVAQADDPAAAAPPGDPDPLAQRDVLLWRITRVRGREALSWSAAAAASQDPLILRALLADLAQDEDRAAMPALRRRVELQAAGELPIDPDPLDQQALYAAVFDDVRASPTGLRPLAVKLQGMVSGLGAGPIARFIARHGAVRPATP